MTELNMTFVQAPYRSEGDSTLSKPIFKTFALSVTSGSTSDLTDYIGHGNEDVIFMNNFEAVGFINSLKKALANNEYPAPGCAYLVQDHFEEMYEMTKAGCNLYIHTE